MKQVALPPLPLTLRTCLLRVCACASTNVWATGCVLLAPFHLASQRDTGLGRYPCMYVCVRILVYMQCSGDAKRNHDVTVLAKENYFKEAYGMC